MKTVTIQVRWAAVHPGQDNLLPGVVTHSKLKRATSVRPRVGIVFKTKTAPGSLSTGSPAGRTPPHGDGSMYGQANVRAGKCAAAPYPSVAVVIVDTEKVLGKRMGPRSARSRGQQCVMGGKVFAAGCASKAGLVSR